MNPYNCPNTFCNTIPIAFPPQHQNIHPGIQNIMVPLPISESPYYRGSNKLYNKVAIITGGDSGIGRSVSILYAREGADIVIVYLSEHEKEDAIQTKEYIENIGRRCLVFRGDISEENFCNKVVNETIKEFNHIDIIVNNAAVIYSQESILNISAEQLLNTFKVNVFSYFFLVKAALPYLKRGSSIINTSSVTAFEPYTISLDYSSTKGAVEAFTRSLAKSLIPSGIRVNSVAPGMTWTPFIPSSQKECDVMLFGRDRPMGRAAQPSEIAPSYVFLASEVDSSYMTGQTLIVT